MAISMLKIRRPNGRLIFNMEIAIRRQDGLYIETGPSCPIHKSEEGQGIQEAEIVRYIELTFSNGTWGCYNIRYPSKTHLKLKSCKMLFVHGIHFICPIVTKCCTKQSKWLSPPCCIPNCKTTGQLSNKLWANDISRDLSLSRVSEEYPILQWSPDAPGRCQATIWINAGILLIRILGTNLTEILKEINKFHSRKCIWKYRLRNGSHFVSASLC